MYQIFKENGLIEGVITALYGRDLVESSKANRFAAVPSFLPNQVKPIKFLGRIHRPNSMTDMILWYEDKV